MRKKWKQKTKHNGANGSITAWEELAEVEAALGALGAQVHHGHHVLCEDIGKPWRMLKISRFYMCLHVLLCFCLFVHFKHFCRKHPQVCCICFKDKFLFETAELPLRRPSQWDLTWPRLRLQIFHKARRKWKRSTYKQSEAAKFSKFLFFSKKRFAVSSHCRMVCGLGWRPSPCRQTI